MTIQIYIKSPEKNVFLNFNWVIWVLEHSMNFGTHLKNCVNSLLRAPESRKLLENLFSKKYVCYEFGKLW